MQLRNQARGTTRDVQRKRVYDAEREFRTWHGEGAPLPTVADVERFVRRVFSAKRVLRRWPFLQDHAIEVHCGAGCRNALAFDDQMIKIPLWARTEFTVLHELAHIIHKRGAKVSVTRQYGIRPPSLDEDRAWYQGHGYQFCRIFLDLVKLYMGGDMERALKRRFKMYRVRYKAPRKLSPEQRLALANRLRRLRGEPTKLAA